MDIRDLEPDQKITIESNELTTIYLFDQIKLLIPGGMTTYVTKNTIQIEEKNSINKSNWLDFDLLQQSMVFEKFHSLNEKPIDLISESEEFSDTNSIESFEEDLGL